MLMSIVPLCLAMVVAVIWQPPVSLSFKQVYTCREHAMQVDLHIQMWWKVYNIILGPKN